MENIKEKLENVKEVKLIEENEDKTKKYMITANEDIDLRKNIFEVLAKEQITIFEMKKADATLEDAFMELIKDTQSEVKQEEKTKDKKEDNKEIKTEENTSTTEEKEDNKEVKDDSTNKDAITEENDKKEENTEGGKE